MSIVSLVQRQHLGHRRKREQQTLLRHSPQLQKRPPKPKVVVQEPARQPKTKKNKTMAYTVEGVLEQWSGTTDFGVTFRALTPLQQLAEVAVLNKGAAKGL